MAECDWAHLCDHAFFDDGGKPCLIGVFRAVFADRVPATHPSAALAFRLEGRPHETVGVKIRLFRPDGKDPLLEMGREADLGPSGELVTVVKLNALPLPDFGPYDFHVILDGDIARQVGFEVVRNTEKPADRQGQG